MSIYCGIDFHPHQHSVCCCDSTDGVGVVRDAPSSGAVSATDFNRLTDFNRFMAGLIEAELLLSPSAGNRLSQLTHPRGVFRQ